VIADRAAEREPARLQAHIQPQPQVQVRKSGERGAHRRLHAVEPGRLPVVRVCGVWVRRR